MSADRSAQIAAATERLRAETTVPGLLGSAARSLVELLDAQGCTISRAIGDLLVDLIQYRRTGESESLGHGYLLSDYPLTREVIEQRTARTVFVEDPEADESETRLLARLGFGALLMIAIESEDAAWGLIEVYGEKGRRFEGGDVDLVAGVAGELGQRLSELRQRA